MVRQELIDLRPLIPEALTEHTQEIEQFQNSVLRPVIKYQHAFICALVSQSAHFNELLKDKGPRTSFHQKVQGFVSKQIDLKNQLIGCILGLLTLEEFDVYKTNPNEYNKRIVQMIVQRITDTVY